MRKILFTLALGLLAFNASAQLSEQEIASNAQWFNNSTKATLAKIAKERFTAGWDAFQIADGPKVYFFCYDPATNIAIGAFYSSRGKHEPFNYLLSLVGTSGCKDDELRKVVSFQKQGGN